jgi:hypothetical protein
MSYKIEVIKRINEGDPDYDAIGEPYYYKVKISGTVDTGSFGNLPINKVIDYYPPDSNDDSEINDGTLPAFYGRMSNETYYDLLSHVKQKAHFWEIKHNLSPQTLNTFGNLIDEL